MMAVQGHPPPELEVGYADEEDGVVEYINDGFDEDQLDEEDFEGEGYPEGLQGRPATSANLHRLVP